MTRKRNRKANMTKPYNPNEWQNNAAPSPLWHSHKGRPFILTIFKNGEKTGLWQARTVYNQELICAEQCDLPLETDAQVIALSHHVKNMVDMTCDNLEAAIEKDKVNNG